MMKVTTKLALSNLLKNRQLYLPYTIANLNVVASTYIFLSLMLNPSLQKIVGGGGVQQVLSLGMFVVLIISFVITLYANSFVMKNRTKELGLYNVLGLEKRHLHLMMLIETIVFSTITTTIGILFGILLDKLAFAALLKVMHMPVKLVPTFQWQTIFYVAISFALIYAVVILLNMIRVQRLRSIELLKESKRGEKTGKFLKTQTVIGLALLGTAYYLAQTVVHPIKSLGTFFIAVLLVIAATYILFNAGTITLLKALKRNEGYYYQPQNFISVSNLMFRMRKNAAGLATICLLSTMSLVTIVGGSILYFGSEETIRQYVPHDFDLEIATVFDTPEEDMSDAIASFEQFAKEQNFPLETLETIHFMQLYGDFVGDSFTLQNGVDYIPGDFASTEIRTIDLTTYNRLTQANVTLTDNEVLFYAREDGTAPNSSTLQLLNQTFTIKEVLTSDPLKQHTSQSATNYVSKFGVLVVPSLKEIQTLIQNQGERYFGFNAQTTGFTTTQSQQGQLNFFEAWQAQAEGHAQRIQSQVSYTTEYYSMAGSIFFIGAFLAVLFTLSLILVIYYKQLSEGFEDRYQFDILQKVGLDHAMIKRTIRKQMLVVFFMPILLAVVHMAFAYKNLSLILSMLSISNAALVLSITCITCVTFVAIYCFIYWITSKQYERIVAA